MDSNLKGRSSARSFVAAAHDQAAGPDHQLRLQRGAHLEPALGVHYTATKAGVLGLTRASGQGYAPHQILVNTVAPGPPTRSASRDPEPRGREQLRVRFPGRFAEPEDIRRGAVPGQRGCAHITGATIDVNGGYVWVSGMNTSAARCNRST